MPSARPTSASGWIAAWPARPSLAAPVRRSAWTAFGSTMAPTGGDGDTASSHGPDNDSTSATVRPTCLGGMRRAQRPHAVPTTREVRGRAHGSLAHGLQGDVLRQGALAPPRWSAATWSFPRHWCAKQQRACHPRLPGQARDGLGEGMRVPHLERLSTHQVHDHLVGSSFHSTANTTGAPRMANTAFHGPNAWPTLSVDPAPRRRRVTMPSSTPTCVDRFFHTRIWTPSKASVMDVLFADGGWTLRYGGDGQRSRVHSHPRCTYRWRCIHDWSLVGEQRSVVTRFLDRAVEPVLLHVANGAGNTAQWVQAPKILSRWDYGATAKSSACGDGMEGTKATCRPHTRGSLGAQRFCPMVQRDVSGKRRLNPKIVRSNVVFPAPLVPNSTCNPPAFQDRLNGSSREACDPLERCSQPSS